MNRTTGIVVRAGLLTSAFACLLLTGCRARATTRQGGAARNDTSASATQPAAVPAPSAPKTEREKFLFNVCAAAIEQTTQTVVYAPAYTKIAYPGGDVPPDRGVCADVLIRAFRKAGIDLQKEVHEDMKAHFGLYPKKWGAKRTDTNIDHRRVRNLMVFFSRKGRKLPVTGNSQDYLPGDVVAWALDSGLDHIGVVVYEKSDDGARCKVVHNIGAGPQLEDALFTWKIIGHYRYSGGRIFPDEPGN